MARYSEEVLYELHAFLEAQASTILLKSLDFAQLNGVRTTGIFLVETEISCMGVKCRGMC